MTDWTDKDKPSHLPLLAVPAAADDPAAGTTPHCDEWCVPFFDIRLHTIACQSANGVDPVGPMWRPIPGYSRYEASDDGRIRFAGGRECRRYADNVGYWAMRAVDDFGKGRTTRTHRLVALAWIGPCPEGYEVNHLSGHKDDNHHLNLEYVTPNENKRHASATGLLDIPRPWVRGEVNGNARLTAAQVGEIRESSASGVELAERYGVAQSTISSIRTGARWRDPILPSRMEMRDALEGTPYQEEEVDETDV